MAFLSSPPLQSFRKRPCVVTRRQTCCSSAPSPSFAVKPRNFFLNTPLIRTPPSVQHSDIADLILSASSLDRFIPLHRNNVVLSETSTAFTPVLWTPEQLSGYLQRTSTSPFTVFLARTISPSISYYALDVSVSPPPLESSQRILPLRVALSKLETETEAALLAHAYSILSWHSTSTYCSNCAHSTKPIRLGTARTCPNPTCSVRNIYPRVMPSILALVLNKTGSQVLLGRKASWPESRYSVLAGFAEIFESLEQTVAREVQEETGVIVDIDTIRYHSSQPWPSQPHASLMSGFRAYVTRDEYARICVNDELEDARWFDKQWLKDNLGKNVSIPGPTSLARRLIVEWMNEAE